MIQHIIEILTIGTVIAMSCLALWLVLLNAVPKGDETSSPGHKRMLRDRSFPY